MVLRGCTRETRAPLAGFGAGGVGELSSRSASGRGTLIVRALHAGRLLVARRGVRISPIGLAGGAYERAGSSFPAPPFADDIPSQHPRSRTAHSDEPCAAPWMLDNALDSVLRALVSLLVHVVLLAGHSPLPTEGHVHVRFQDQSSSPNRVP